MTKLYPLFPAIIALFFLNSCSAIKFGNKNELESGYYKNSESEKVYIHEEEEKIYLFEIKENKLELNQIIENNIEATEIATDYSFRRNSFDIDLISIPIKYRFANEYLPAQLNTALSAAIFIGFRKDFHSIKYEADLFGTQKRSVSSLGFSLGILSGFSHVDINETTTQFLQEKEYEGVAWMNGINGIVGWNQFSFGLVLGFDFLLDQNKDIWIYNKKPWIGFSIGLNLN